MPFDPDKALTLVLQKFPGHRPGTISAIEFDVRLKEASQGWASRRESSSAMSYGVFRQMLEGRRTRVYLDQVEILARVLEVPINELLDQEFRNASYEAGLSAGVVLAAGEMQDSLNQIVRSHVSPPERENLPDALISSP